MTESYLSAVPRDSTILTAKGKGILHDLAKCYVDICNRPEQQERRKRWRAHSSFKGNRPRIYVRAYASGPAWAEMPQSVCHCENPTVRGHENFFRSRLFWDTFNDDFIFEPWITVPAVCRNTRWGSWPESISSGMKGGAIKLDYPIKELDDTEKLHSPQWYKETNGFHGHYLPDWSGHTGWQPYTLPIEQRESALNRFKRDAFLDGEIKKDYGLPDTLLRER